MYLPVVLSYPEFLKKIGPIIGSDLRLQEVEVRNGV